MNSNQLRQFITLARLPSFSQAARELGIAQPALSQRIAALELELETKLFVRHARGARLTPEGDRLLAQAEDLIRRLESLKAELHVAPGAVVGTVSLGIASGIAGLIAPPLISRIEREYPKLELVLSEALSFRLRRQVEEGQLDLAIVPGSAELPSLLADPLFVQNFALVGATSLLGTDRSPIGLKDIADLPLVSTDRSHDLRLSAEEAARKANVVLNVRYEINSVAMITGLVAAGIACAILPEQGFRPDNGAESVVLRRVVAPEIYRWQSIVRRASKAASAPVDAVQTSLRQIVDELGLSTEI